MHNRPPLTPFSRVWLQYWLIDPVWGAIDYLTHMLLRCLSWRAASATGARIGLVARHRFTQAVGDTLANLENLRPDLTGRDREVRALTMWSNIGRTLTEMAVLDRYDLARNTDIDCGENLGAQDRHRPVIFLFPHLGNWEILALHVVSLGFRLNVLYERLPNRFQRRLVASARRRSGYELVDPDYSGTRQLFRVLARGESVGIAMDEFRDGRIIAPWPPAAPPERSNIHYAIELARRFDALIISGYSLRRDGASFDLHYDLRLDLREAAVRACTDSELAGRINQLLWHRVQANPEQWYMLHRARLGVTARAFTDPGLPETSPHAPDGNVPPTRVE